MTPILVFDIETIPDVDGIRRLENLPATLDDAAVAEHAFAARREKTGGDFLPHYLQRIAAISCVFRDNNGFRVRSLGTPQDNEAALVQSFYRVIEKYTPQLVSWNGGGFDLPVLQLQAMAAHRFELKGLGVHTHAHRYGATHCDLADQFSGYGGTRRTSLAELCAPLGIPAKTSVHGSEVGALWRDGAIEAITAYVEEDVLATYLLWLHWAAARANDESLIAVPLADLARWIERTPDLAHLKPFAVCRPAIWARPRALFHTTRQSLSKAERRVQREADERAFAGEPPIF